MSEQQIDWRRNWKAETFEYDIYLPDESEECQYCLTRKQAEILSAIVTPLAWKTRWWSDSDTDIDQDTIEAFRDDIIRRLMMSCCGGQFDVMFRWTEDGVLQKSTDGGTTWEDSPQDDPRNSSPIYPPVPGSPSDDKKCIAANSVKTLIKEQVGGQLTDDMSRYTLNQLISDWVGTVIATGGNIFEALTTVIANQILALVIATLRPALTDDVYSKLQCCVYCNMASDLSFNDAQWANVRACILADITGIAGIFLEHLVFLIGKVGLTNLARSQAATDGDCSACDCFTCASGWDVYNSTYGTVLASGDGTLQVQANLVSGQYYIIITTHADNDCCAVSYTMDAGSDPGAAWNVCGESWVTGPNHTGLFSPGACVNYIQMQAFSPFTVTFAFDDCP